jgi:alkanesulfonate monooxygenase SsuD/methylene tetrahydromethanopterin reductase-like flavin-dependent oxidoreductase (luciferase family)
MPCRNVVPKPVQKPHPPMWLACSNRETIHVAAQLGLGALTFAFVDPSEARHWVDDYYQTLERECVPIGHAVNANIAMVTGFSCHREAEEARRRGVDGFRFFGYALAHFYLFGTHKPGRTNVWQSFEAVRDAMPEIGGSSGIGTPDELREHIRKFEAVGVDQVIFIQQGGRNRHEHICESLELFAREVMPAFKEHEDKREREKRARLAPAIEAALGRKQFMAPLADDAIPQFGAYGRTIVDPATPQGKGAGLSIPTQDPARS